MRSLPARAQATGAWCGPVNTSVPGADKTSRSRVLSGWISHPQSPAPLVEGEGGTLWHLPPCVATRRGLPCRSCGGYRTSSVGGLTR